MKQKDIEKKIEGLYTPVGKLSYLHEVETKHPGLLNDETKRAFGLIREKYDGEIQEEYDKGIQNIITKPKDNFQGEVKNFTNIYKNTGIKPKVKRRNIRKIHKKLLESRCGSYTLKRIREFREATGEKPSKRAVNDYVYDKEIFRMEKYFPPILSDEKEKDILYKTDWEEVEKHIEDTGVKPYKKMMEDKFKNILEKRPCRKEDGKPIRDLEYELKEIKKGTETTGIKPRAKDFKKRVSEDIDYYVKNNYWSTSLRRISKEIETMKDMGINPGKKNLKNLVYSMIKGRCLGDSDREKLKYYLDSIKLSKKDKRDLLKELIKREEWFGITYLNLKKDLYSKRNTIFKKEIQKKQKKYIKELKRIEPNCTVGDKDHCLRSILYTGINPKKEDLHKIYSCLNKVEDYDGIMDFIERTEILPKNPELAKEMGEKTINYLEDKGKGRKALKLRRKIKRLKNK
ncbi:hypothetical protein JW949_04650 [Candidatus Woesearchaeota archaeon]|nr:hypothetical protein [Candidatus Woesearchaeota archaeon]